MRRGALLVLVTAAFLLGLALPAYALEGYELGVSNGREYREMVFVGGTPKLYVGTVKTTSKTRGNVVQTTLTYKLKAQGGTDALSRTVKLESDISKNDTQEVYATRLVSMTESLQVGGLKLKLNKDSLYFTASRVIDHRPISDFYTENWHWKKVYEAGKGGSTITVEASGQRQGYSNAWGAGSTDTITVTIDSAAGSTSGTDWQGTLEAVAARSSGRDLKYIANPTNLISFSGGYLEEKTGEESLKVSYDLPYIDATGAINNSSRVRDTVTASMTTPVTQKRLFVKEFRDVRGHWAQRQIEAMCGLLVFDNRGNFFGPGYNATREDLARGLAVLCNLVPQETAARTTRTAKAETEHQYFIDVPPGNPNYKYIQELAKRGVLEYSSEQLFRPRQPLTRAEAATFLVNSLGLTRLAPAPGYQTPFLDDASIPSSARDSVYVANELGLIQGENGLFRPNDTMTRAELAVLLDNFRQYLNVKFRQDYYSNVYPFN